MQRRLTIVGIVALAVAAAALIVAWQSAKPVARVDGAEARWRTGRSSKDVFVGVADANGNAIPGAMVRVIGDHEHDTAHAYTDRRGHARLRLGKSDRLRAMSVNGVDLMTRRGWWAPSLDDGLRIHITVHDRVKLRLAPAGEGDGVALSPDAEAELAAIRRQLLDAEGDWTDAWRALVMVGEPGWAMLVDAVFDMQAESDHLRGVTIEPTQRSTSGFYDYYRQRLRERLEDERWAMAWAASVLRRDESSVLPPPWVGSYVDPKEARLDVAFARIVYGRDFAYPWHGSAEAQREAIERWRRWLRENEADNAAIVPRIPSFRRIPERFDEAPSGVPARDTGARRPDVE